MRGTCGGEEMHQEDSSHVQFVGGLLSFLVACLLLSIYPKIFWSGSGLIAKKWPLASGPLSFSTSHSRPHSRQPHTDVKGWLKLATEMSSGRYKTKTSDGKNQPFLSSICLALPALTFSRSTTCLFFSPSPNNFSIPKVKTTTPIANVWQKCWNLPTTNIVRIVGSKVHAGRLQI